MAEWEDEPRDLAALTVRLVGSVVDTGDPWEPWRLLDPAGVPGVPNPITGKPGPGRSYAPRTRVHSETVLRGFYDFHQDAASGPMVNPFPLVRGRRHGRAHAHHNPIEPYRDERGGLYRPA